MQGLAARFPVPGKHRALGPRALAPTPGLLLNRCPAVIPDEIYAVNVEIWPTNVVVEKGEQIMLEVSLDDTQGCDDCFQHNSPVDRPGREVRGTESPSLWKVGELCDVTDYPSEVGIC